MSIEYYIAAFNWDQGSNNLSNSGMESSGYWLGSGSVSSYYFSTSIYYSGGRSLAFQTDVVTPWLVYTSNSWWFANNSDTANGTWNVGSYAWESGSKYVVAVWLNDIGTWVYGKRFSHCRMTYYSVGSKNFDISYLNEDFAALYLEYSAKYGTGRITTIYSLNWTGVSTTKHLHTINIVNNASEKFYVENIEFLL